MSAVLNALMIVMALTAQLQLAVAPMSGLLMWGRAVPVVLSLVRLKVLNAQSLLAAFLLIGFFPCPQPRAALAARTHAEMKSAKNPTRTTAFHPSGLFAKANAARAVPTYLAVK